MIENLNIDEIEFCECLYDPIALSESLFSDYDNMAIMKDEELAHVRMGQFPLLSYEYLIDDIPDYSDKDNFRLKEGGGNIRLGGAICAPPNS